MLAKKKKINSVLSTVGLRCWWDMKRGLLVGIGCRDLEIMRVLKRVKCEQGGGHGSSQMTE